MAEKAERVKTRYEVMGKDGEMWHVIGEVEANNGLAAITALAKAPGILRAVPVRNITEQAMGNPPPEPPKLVPVDPDQLTFADALADEIAEVADTPEAKDAAERIAGV